MKSILIVEDDEELLQQLVTVLKSRYNVFACTTVSEASKIATNNPLDGIISDFYLPDGSATDLIHFKFQQYAKPKTVVMTAHAQKNLVIECLNMGVSGFIEKPFLKEQFDSFIEEHFGHKSGRKDFSLCPVKNTFTHKDIEISLTEIEFKILACFFTHPGQWVQRNTLIQEIWGDSLISRNILDTHLANLKNKVPTLKNSIKNLRGKGYLIDLKAL